VAYDKLGHALQCVQNVHVERSNELGVLRIGHEVAFAALSREIDAGDTRLADAGGVELRQIFRHDLQGAQ